MSTHEDNFKKQLDDLLSSRAFPFEEPAWNNMAGLLDQKKRKRRLIYFFWIGLLTGLTGLATWFVFNNHNTSKIENTLATKVTQGATAVKGSENITTAAVERAEKKTSEKKTPETSDLNMPPKNNTIHPATEKRSPAHTKPKSVSADLPLRSNESTQSVKNDTGIVPKDKKVSPNVTQTTITQTEASHIPTTETLPELVKDIVAVATPQTAPVEKGEKKTPEEKNLVISDTAPDTIINKKDEVPEPTPAAPVAQVDTTLMIQAARPDTDYVHHSRPDLRLEAGGSWLSGWKEKEGRDGSGFNPLAGLHYYLPLTREFSLGIGLQYTQVAHLKYSHYTATVTRVDLGKTVQATEFTPRRLHYLMLPVRIALRLDERQSAGMGFNFAYLLTVDSRVKAYTEDRNGVRTLSTYKVKGYTEGFNDFDAQLCFFYQRRLTNRFRFNAEIVLGLKDVKNGQALISNGFERNSGLRLSIMYSIFEK